MNDKRNFSLILLIGVVLAASNARGQEPPPKTDDPLPYSVTSSIELGARGVSVDGNADKFRSDLNYEPGFRLFDSSLLMRSNGAGGKAFDSLMVNSYGWGGDPTGYLRINAEKLSWYRFDATVRRFDYFNSLTNIALHQHISNTERKIGDFDLELMPQNQRLRVTLGYSMDRNSGTGVTTYSYARDEFPIVTPVRSGGDEYRAGVEAKLWVFDLSFLQGIRYFKDDTTYTVTSQLIGNNPANFTVLDTLHRDLPTRGRIPYTRFGLHTFLAKRVDVTSRVVYQSATTRYELLETVTGKDSSNNNVVLDRFNASGNTKRPHTLGDLGVTVFATNRLKISESFRVNTFRIDGGQALSQALFRNRPTATGVVELPPVFTDSVSFRMTSYRRVVNTIEADYQFHPRFSAHIGQRYTDRRIELGELTGPSPGEFEPEEFDNRTNTIFLGFRARPASIWTLYFDMESGETDNVFTRVENYNFTNFRARSRIKPARTLSVNLSLITKDNNNPSLTLETPQRNFGVDVNSRIYSSSVDWTPGPYFSLSSGYTRSHLTSEAAIIFFFNSASQEGRSRYFLRDDFAFLNTTFQIGPRVLLFGGYRIHRDRGQGDRVSTLPDDLITSYPQQYQTPEFRMALKLTNRISWNVGYQYFDFQETFPNLQRYEAHLPYTSLTIRFDRGVQ